MKSLLRSGLEWYEYEFQKEEDPLKLGLLCFHEAVFSRLTMSQTWGGFNEPELRKKGWKEADFLIKQGFHYEDSAENPDQKSD